MTDIDTLPAGTELDLLVAEKVMGWTRKGDNDERKPLHTTRTIQVDGGPKTVEPYDNWDRRGPHPKMERGWEVVYLCGCRDQHPGSRMPAYPTDIADAWEVVERMRARGYRLYLRHDEDGRRVHVQFTLQGDDGSLIHLDHEVIGDAEEMFFVICRAALAAVGAG